jgi:predicted transcriptional regulator
MLNQQMISPEITPLQPGQTVEEALHSMEQLSVSHLPVVKDGLFEGLLSEDDLLDAAPEDRLEALQADLQAYAVNAEDHFLSAIRTMASRNLSLVPVITASREYVGSIDRDTLFMQLVRQTGVLSGGAMVMLEMEPQQFSISELSKLVETNDAHITQLNTVVDELSGQLTVTIRINKQEVSDIVATLQRYDYHVAYYSGEEHYENELRRNYNHLMNFLTI